MTDVERLLAEYKQAHRTGGDADPSPFLARTSGVEREQLAALIDAYLERAPRRDFDAATFRESPAAAVADLAYRSLAGSAGLWPVLLPASGVSDTVLEALGKIVGYGKEALRTAGQMPAPGGPPPEAGAVYARTTR